MPLVAHSGLKKAGNSGRR